MGSHRRGFSAPSGRDFCAPSALAWKVWAKTGTGDLWLPLPQHLIDTLEIAGRLYDGWVSRAVRERWESGPLGGDIRSVARFLAAAHDVGKAAPAFVAQSEPLAQVARAAGLPCAPMDELRDDRAALPHSLIGQYSLYLWLQERGVPRATARALSSVVGGHHGRPITHGQLQQATLRPRGLGGAAWGAVRADLLEWAAEATGFGDLLSEPDSMALDLPVLVELTGFVIVADWLASNTRLFPLISRDADPTLTDRVGRAGFAWDEIAMPAPWQPPPLPADPTSIFRARFGWDAGVTPRPTQLAAFALARETDVGLMCIETTTGDGKTEAALVVAELLAARRGCQGLLIALPTQATTDAMFGRVRPWLEALPHPPADVAAWSLVLGHGKARLNREFSAMSTEAARFERWLPSSTELSRIYGPDDLTNAVVHQWFLTAKRRLLANFAVVTIDQLLMAGLQRRHLMLAHLALSGKVVIIDEAHSSDEFMNVYEDTVLNWLGTYQVPVVVLSATLTLRRRRELMRAYAPHRQGEIDSLETDEAAYPLVTVVPRDESPIVQRRVDDPRPGREVHLEWLAPELPAVVAAVRASVRNGGCALVVRNTVADAQATADALADSGVEVILSHARFMSVDRVRNDETLRTRFGKDGAQRPHRCVVVATQVAEQSLDIDFDVLFTDLAPLDLLLQRIGRLHRHTRSRPDGLVTARVHVLAAEDDGAAPPRPTPGSVAVYGDHHLLRTSATLLEHGPLIRLPADVAPLVQRALGEDRVGPDAWQGRLIEAARQHGAAVAAQRDKASTWRLEPWRGTDDERVDLGQWLFSADDREETAMIATVRDVQPTLEVIVVPTTPDGATAIRPPWLAPEQGVGAETLDTSSLPSDDLAREIASWSVRLPARLSWPHLIGATIEAIDTLPTTRRWAWRRHPLLKGELLVPMAQHAEGGTALSTVITVKGVPYALHYTPERGLEVNQP